MENFKNVLKKRLTLMLVFDAFAIVFIVLTGVFGNLTAGGSESLSDMIRGFQAGVFACLQVLIFINIIKYARALKNENEIRKLYFAENDERVKLIKDKIGGTGFNFILGSIATATVISGFFSQMVFITLLWVLIFIALVKGTLKIYYRNKF